MLVADPEMRIIGLVLAGQGSPYKGLWSLLHGVKRPQELSRDSCVRVATEMVGNSIAPTAGDAYCMVEHSTPNVFSYTCLVRREIAQALPPTQDGQVTHIQMEQFYKPLTRENLPVVDCFGKQRLVSRHTHKVVLEWVNEPLKIC